MINSYPEYTGPCIVVTVHDDFFFSVAEYDELQTRTYDQPLWARTVPRVDQLTFLDSTGVTALVAADSYARRDGWSLTIVKGPPQVSASLRSAA